MRRLKKGLSNNPLIIALDDLDKEMAFKYIRELLGRKIFNNGVWGIQVSHPSINNRETIMELKRLGVGGVFSNPALNLMPRAMQRTIGAYTTADFISIHASGGPDMIRAAVQNSRPASILALTVMTSFDNVIGELIFGRSIEAEVLILAMTARIAGVDGFICPPRELRILNKYRNFLEMRKSLILVSPAIRSRRWRGGSQHQETMTPKDAIASGADYLVIGGEITDPIANYKKLIRKRDYKKDPASAESQAWKTAVEKSIEAINGILDDLSPYLIDDDPVAFIQEQNQR
jgi:orotidine-5'-phosphate decarboxylase